jgi:hypothetical protein
MLQLGDLFKAQGVKNANVDIDEPQDAYLPFLYVIAM